MPMEEKEYASKGVAGTGLGLGIAGTALALLSGSGNGNGILGRIFGGNCNNNCENNGCCGGNTPVNRFELNQSQEIAILAERNYTDEKIIEAYKQSVADNKVLSDRMRDQNETTNKALAELDKQTALNKQANDYNFLLVNREFECIKGTINKLSDRVDAITKEVVPLTAICPQPLSGCVPVGFQGHIVPTTPTGETNTVLSAREKPTA